MSIIYEALKKTQNGPQGESNLPPKPTSIPAADKPVRQSHKPRAVFLRTRRSFVLALTGITAVILITRLIANKPTAQSSHKKIYAKQTPSITAFTSHAAAAAGTNPVEKRTRSAREKLQLQETPELILNGIVLSLDGNLALINEEILKVGDDIRGAKVEEIIDQQVTLTLQGKKIILKKR